MLRRRRLDDERISEATAKPQITPSVPILIAPTPIPAQFIAEETRQDDGDENLSRRLPPPPPPPPSNILEAAAKALLLDEIRDEPAIMAARKLFDDLPHQLTQIEMSATTYNVSDGSPSVQKAKGLVIDADLFSIGTLESTDDESDTGSSNGSKSSNGNSSTASSDSSKDDKMSSSNKEEDVEEEKIIEIIDETDELDLDAVLSPRSSAKKPAEGAAKGEGDEEDICDEFKVFMGAAAPIKFAS